MFFENFYQDNGNGRNPVSCFSFSRVIYEQKPGFQRRSKKRMSDDLPGSGWEAA